LIFFSFFFSPLFCCLLLRFGRGIGWWVDERGGGSDVDRETFFEKRKACRPMPALLTIPPFLQLVLIMVAVGRELDLLLLPLYRG